MSRKRALVVCPGRGTYNKDELGYLARHHEAQAERLTGFDARRAALGQEPLSALDGAAKYSLSKHTRGDNASGLIYACSLFDYMAIDREAYDIVGVTGNSMGWYTALACGGALNAEAGFELVNTMGTLMQESLIGGQLIYPFVDENWREIAGRREEVLALVAQISELSVSIYLGGMLVLAGDDAALSAAEARLPVVGRFPMRLKNHAGFHAPMQEPVAAKGRAALRDLAFKAPDVSLIDGRGQGWLPFSSDPAELFDYTLGHQVVAPYDFTKAVQNSLRELAPEVVIVLGPGNTLGGAVAQCITAMNWQGMDDKESFATRQTSAPFVLSMGLVAQRAMAENTPLS